MATDKTGTLPSEAWREALRLWEAWGEEADLEAARQADACLDAGDLDGQARWRRVLRALDALQRSVPEPGEGRA